MRRAILMFAVCAALAGCENLPFLSSKEDPEPPAAEMSIAATVYDIAYQDLPTSPKALIALSGQYDDVDVIYRPACQPSLVRHLEGATFTEWNPNSGAIRAWHEVVNTDSSSAVTAKVADDGSWAAALMETSEERTIRVIDLESWQSINEFPIDSGHVLLGVGMNSEHRHAITYVRHGDWTGYAVLKRWDVDNGTMVDSLNPGQTFIYLSDFAGVSPDGRYVYDSIRSLVDVEAGQITTTSSLCYNPWAISSDGSTLVGKTSDDHVATFSTATGELLREFTVHCEPRDIGGGVWPCGRPKSHDVSAVAISPDGSVIATAGWDYSICIWNANTGKRIRRIQTDTAPDRLLLSPDLSRIAAAHETGLIRVWKVEP